MAKTYQTTHKGRGGVFRFLATSGVVALTLLTGCGNESEVSSRSIEEIHRTEGVPIEIRTVNPESFRTYLSFTTTLTGGQESVAGALVSDEVAGVLYSVGDYVEKGEAIVVFPPDNPQLNYEQARVGFEAARTAFERVQRLYDGEGISTQSYDDAKTQYEIARANWMTVQDMANVKAPISGYLTRINVLESDNVRQGDSLFTVSDYSRLKATVWLTDRQIGEVRVGQPARAIWQGIEVEGEVIQVDLSMDRHTNAFAAKVQFENSQLRINSGVTATVEIETYRNDQALVLRHSEVIDNGASLSTYVARDGLAVRVPINNGRQQDLSIEVTNGLTPGDQVISRGMELVSDGIPVQIIDMVTQR